MSRIMSIVYTPKGSRKSSTQYTRVPIETANLVAGYGIEGDTKGGSRKRQLNLMSAEMIEQLQHEGYKTAPGELGEQIVIAGLDVVALVGGERIQIGESACVEIIALREPCERFAGIQGKTAASAEGRVGVMAKVVASGVIRVGDEVKMLERA
jgi:MOSC domain-containing protein YiiM